VILHAGGCARRAELGRLAGDRMDLQRPDHPPWVALRPFRGRPIDEAKLGIQRLRSFALQPPLEGGAEGQVGRGVGEIPAVKEGPKIQARPALQHRDPSLRRD